LIGTRVIADRPKLELPADRKSPPLSLVWLHLLLVSVGSSALVLGPYYLKWDWIGAWMIMLYSVYGLPFGHIRRGFALGYACIFVGGLLVNGLVLFVTSGGELPRYGSYLAQYVMALSTLVVLSSAAMSHRRVMQFMNLWLMIACIACLLAVAQAMTHSLLVDDYLFIPGYADNRISYKAIAGNLAATAWFAEASWFGAFLVVPFFYSFSMFSSHALVTLKGLVYRGAFVLVLVGVILGYSLTTFGAIAVGFAAMFLFPGDRWFRTKALGLCALVVLLAVLLLWNTSLWELIVDRARESYSNFTDFTPGMDEPGRVTSFSVRSVGFYEGFLDFLANPVFGIGLGQGAVPYHSGLITLLAEQGLVGAVIYYALPAYVIGALLRHRKRAAPAERNTCTFIVVALIADFADGAITQHPFYLQRWLLISISLGWIFWLRDHGNLAKTSNDSNEQLSRQDRYGEFSESVQQ
jgi:hypothetical protein